MISHFHKCIFVHIQRTAGTSFEYWLTGSDWWQLAPHEKHLTAHQTKQLYADYWDDYFKFSIVRNPWDRVVSLGKYRNTGVLQDDAGKLEIDGWLASIEKPPIEFDQRYHSRSEVLRGGIHQPGTLYSNILDEPLDYVGRFENLNKVADRVKDSIENPPQSPLPHLDESKNRTASYTNYYTEAVWGQVSNVHAAELAKWGY